MAQTIKLKRSATSGAVPTTSALELGEMAINTHDGKVYIKKNNGTESVVEIGAGSSYSAGTGISLSGTTFSLTDTNAKLNLSGGTMTGNLTISIPDGGTAPATTAVLDIRGYEGRGAGIKIRDSANSASNANNREWFIGSGYSQSGFSIGYSATGSQSSYTAQNKLSIDTSGNVTAAGTITATGYNDSNWNTAYGWGNHATAGYLTSYTDTNTTYSAGTGVTLTGTTFSLTDTNAKLNLSGGTLTGALKLEGGSYSSGTDTATVALAVDKGDYIYSDDGTYLRRIIGHTTGGAIEIGQNGTALINSVNLLTGSSGNSAAKVNGNTIWNAGNDGSGSGLDADLLDGQHGSYYYSAGNPPPLTADPTLTLTGDVTGSATFTNLGNATLTATVGNDSHYHSQVYIPDTRGAQRAPSYYPDKYVSFDFQNNADTLAGGDSWNVLQTVAPWSVYDTSHRQQQLAWTGTGGLKFRYATSESAWAGWQTLWTSGNDGSGSGLDSDLLDGVEGSGYVNTTGIQTIGGIKNFKNILAVTGAETGGYPLQQMTSSSASTYPRIEFGYTGQASRGRLQYNNTGDSMAFYTATAERMRIDSSGNLLVSKTASNASVTGCELNSNGIIYSTIEIPVLAGGLQVRNNAGAATSLTGIRCYNGLADIPTTSSTGGGHSLSISGGLSGEYARFTNAKRLGIGTTAPAQALHVVGSIVATGNITAYYSDERLKDLKGTIPNALDKVNQLNGYYYTPNETAQSLGVDNKGLEVGISAQEVEAVLPEIVTKSAIGDDYKTVWYEKLTPLLIEAVKELTEKVDKLEARLTELEK